MLENDKQDFNIDSKMAQAEKTLKKEVRSRERGEGESAEAPSGPVGLDIGTSHIIVAQNERRYIRTTNELNAFFTIPHSKFARNILVKNDVFFFEQDDLYYIVGYSAENFANMFDTDTRRSIKQGLLCSDEKEGLTVIQAIILSLIQKPKRLGEILCFGIPGDPIDGIGSVTYHESIIKMFINRIGFTPISINEGMAVVLSELAEHDYTGIGISIGGGMCNVCLSYLSFPVLTYSIQMGGDYIDSSAGSVVGIPATKVKAIKEKELSLIAKPKDRLTTALHIFYNELIQKLQKSMERVLSASNQIPMISKPIPIVLSGGTAMPEGFTDKFQKSLANVRLPVEISSVHLAEDPLNTTAKGALIMAMTEETPE
ncbi:MAG: hypothetical protein HQK62_00840 [Desulfamplus sp.]|nr:hypothetical protein [Desulfamplus sp.]MBF0257378.1 hypothetical protein [Desulfamplus sp.]